MSDLQLSNFGFLSANKTYASFASACMEAEKALVVSLATSAILSRRALELAVKWLFTYDSDLKVPYQDNLSSLIHDVTFLRVIDQSMLPQLKYITKLGNVAVHSNATISRGEAILSLRNLFNFISWIDYCYSVEYTARSFDEQLLLEENKQQEKVRPQELQDLYDRLSSKDCKLEDLIKENEELRKLLTERKAQNTQEALAIGRDEYLLRIGVNDNLRQHFGVVAISATTWVSGCEDVIIKMINSFVNNSNTISTEVGVPYPSRKRAKHSFRTKGANRCHL